MVLGSFVLPVVEQAAILEEGVGLRYQAGTEVRVLPKVPILGPRAFSLEWVGLQAGQAPGLSSEFGWSRVSRLLSRPCHVILSPRVMHLGVSLQPVRHASCRSPSEILVSAHRVCLPPPLVVRVGFLRGKAHSCRGHYLLYQVRVWEELVLEPICHGCTPMGPSVGIWS